MPSATNKLKTAWSERKTLLSIGLEPSMEYLPDGFDRNLEGLDEFLRLIIDATEGLAAAYKFNIAFFESLGWEGMELLYGFRDLLPDDSLIIMDAKRGDIGTTAKHYAKAMYESLAVDSMTVNPLMGFDSAEPFLEYEDKLTFFLVLTSNPSASDFLIPNGLYKDIAGKVASWNKVGNCGFVTGATRPEYLKELREIAGNIPFLVPGVGAQGGDLKATIENGMDSNSDYPGLLIHATRGILPAQGEKGDPMEIIRQKTTDLRDQINKAIPN